MTLLCKLIKIENMGNKFETKLSICLNWPQLWQTTTKQMIDLYKIYLTVYCITLSCCSLLRTWKVQPIRLLIWEVIQSPGMYEDNYNFNPHLVGGLKVPWPFCKSFSTLNCNFCDLNPHPQWQFFLWPCHSLDFQIFSYHK